MGLWLMAQRTVCASISRESSVRRIGARAFKRKTQEVHSGEKVSAS